MPDTLDQPTRSNLMSRVKGKNTGPELALRRALHKRGLRYRLHTRKLSGTPDLYFPRFNVALFVHGCFWHRHEGCRYTTTPKSRIDFWNEKFQANINRDKLVVHELRHQGLRVGIVWTCALRSSATTSASAEKIIDWMLSDSEIVVIGDDDQCIESIGTSKRENG